MRPGAFEIGAERKELLPLRLAKRGRTPRDHGREIALNPRNGLQSLVPSALQLTGNEPVGWIDSVVLSTGMSRLVPSRLQ